MHPEDRDTGKLVGQDQDSGTTWGRLPWSTRETKKGDLLLQVLYREPIIVNEPGATS
ncbi:hypothetical protein [Actinoplanes sp. NPDC051494]|uniref:hypothetical protein n=1 Tax=Actinoplanes sp. NPDC051494 TaxID=3363907 RepID=UPI00379E8318